MPTLEIKCQLFVAPLLWTGRRTSKRLSVSLDGLTKKRICFRDAKGDKEEFILERTPQVTSARKAPGIC